MDALGKGDGWAPSIRAYNLMVATETLGQTGGVQEERLDVRGSLRAPRAPQNSLALEGPAQGAG